MEDNKNKIITEYEKGVSIVKLAKFYNVNGWSIKNILIKNNIKIRTNSDIKIKFNENFFFSNTAETYYFWGFMLGDGCLITHKQGHKYITISLKDTDESILIKFCNWLNIDVKQIKRGTNNCKTNYVRLELYGKFFSENDFSKYGLVSNKTYNPVIPDIPQEFIAPFIVGLIDADGSISFDTYRQNKKYSSKEYSLNIVGHPIIMNWLVNQLRLIGYEGNINSQIIKNKWKRIRIQRKNDIIILGKILRITEYNNIFLKRKWQTLYSAIFQ